MNICFQSFVSSLLLLLPFFLPSTASANPTEVAKIIDWGAKLEQVRETKALKSVMVDSSATRQNPTRLIKVQQYIVDSEDIRSLLSSLASIFGKEDFTVIGTHNLAESNVLLRFQSNILCEHAEQFFVVNRTKKSSFYVGCQSPDPSNSELFRISSLRLEQLFIQLIPPEFRGSDEFAQ